MKYLDNLLKSTMLTEDAFEVALEKLEDAIDRRSSELYAKAYMVGLAKSSRLPETDSDSLYAAVLANPTAEITSLVCEMWFTLTDKVLSSHSLSEEDAQHYLMEVGNNLPTLGRFYDVLSSTDHYVEV